MSAPPVRTLLGEAAAPSASARPATPPHWPDRGAVDRAREALGHVGERAAMYRNAARTPCISCGCELSTRWRRVGPDGAQLCSACMSKPPGPDRQALAALGIADALAAVGSDVDDVATLSSERWSQVLVAALAARRTQGAGR